MKATKKSTQVAPAAPVKQSSDCCTTAPRVQMYRGISCATEDANGWDINMFDVPREGYVEGNRTGIRIAREVLEFVRRYPLHPIGGEGIIQSVINAACNTLAETKGRPGDTSGGEQKDGRGAAVGFISAISQVLSDCAASWSWQPSLDRMELHYEEIEDAEACHG